MRMDLIFSYWIFAWYLLYIFKIINYNPKFAILCGLGENILILLLMFYYNTNRKLILLFFTMMIILKLVPLYSIWNTKINNNDILNTIILFIIYILWITYNNYNLTNFKSATIELILHNKTTMPGINFLNKFI